MSKRTSSQAWIGNGKPNRSFGNAGDTWVDRHSAEQHDDGETDFLSYIKQGGHWLFYVRTYSSVGRDADTGEPTRVPE